MEKDNFKHEKYVIHGVIVNFLCGVGIENVDVVDLETAKHLREFGFDKPTHWYWLDKTLTFVEKGLKRVKMGKRRINHNKYDEFVYSAPTREEVGRWLKSLKTI